MENPQLIRTTPQNPDFRELIALLDAELAINDGDEHPFFAQHNKTDNVKHAVVAYWDGVPAGTGAVKRYSGTQAEIKRMFVHPDFRGRGIASAIVKNLEDWARALGFVECLLETGVKQVEAVRLYPKLGYEITQKYPPYENSESSVCMKKPL